MVYKFLEYKIIMNMYANVLPCDQRNFYDFGELTKKSTPNY